MCSPHYMRWWRHGDPLLGHDNTNAPKGEPLRYFERAISEQTDDCQIWPYAKYSAGHGVLHADGEHLVTRISLLRTVGPPPDGRPFACRACRNPSCFNPRHLYWGSPRRNMLDKNRDGTMARGSRHGNAKLTEASVRDIREARAAGVALADLAKKYGVRTKTIDMAATGQTWSHVT